MLIFWHPSNKNFEFVRSTRFSCLLHISGRTHQQFLWITASEPERLGAVLGVPHYWRTVDCCPNWASRKHREEAARCGWKMPSDSSVISKIHKLSILTIKFQRKIYRNFHTTPNTDQSSTYRESSQYRGQWNPTVSFANSSPEEKYVALLKPLHSLNIWKNISSNIKIHENPLVLTAEYSKDHNSPLTNDTAHLYTPANYRFPEGWCER